LSISSVAVARQVSFLVACEALAWWPSLWQPLVRLYGIPVGSSALVSLLPGGTRTVEHVHRYRHIVHPWWHVGRGYLSWCEASCRLGVPWLEVLLAIIVAKVLEVRCILHDQIDQLHRFDDCNEASLHGAIGGRYWWGECFVQ